VAHEAIDQPRKLAKNTAFLLAAQIVARASGFILAVVITRSLGAAGLGIYATAMAVYSSAQRAGMAGTGTYLVREMAKDSSRAGHLLVHVSAVSLVVTGTLTAGLLLLVPFLGYSGELELSVMIGVFAVIPRILNAIQSNAFVAWGDTRFQPLVTLVGAIAMITTSLAVLVAGGSIAAVVAVFVAIEYLKVLVWYALINRHIVRLRWRVQPRVALGMFWEMRTFTASSILNAFFSGPEIILLSVLASEREVGYYSATLKVIELWSLLPAVFMSNVYPLLARSFHRADGRFPKLQATSIRILLAISLPIAVGLAAVAPQIIGLLYGSGFDRSVDGLRLMAANVVLFALLEVFWRVLSARDRHGDVVRSQLISIPVRLGTGFVLMSEFGSVGAALATTAGIGLHVAILIVMARRSGAPVALASSLRTLVASLAMGAAVWALAPYVPLVPLIAVGAVAYVGLLLLVRALPPEDRALARQVFTRKARPAPGT
jgi:O-antigen/teichoic acid export membrane protein